MAKVSVIVPVYNVEKYLKRCLDSLVNQTLDDCEIIVVNDGSPDGSQRIIDDYQRKYPEKIRAYKKENGGLSDARNYGLERASGEYVGFVDSDDYVNTTMYEKLWNKAVSEDADIVVCPYYRITGRDVMQSADKGHMGEFGAPLSQCPGILEHGKPYAWNKLYRRSLFTESGIQFPKGYIFEDIPTVYPLMTQARRISKVNEELYYYVDEREGSITNTYNSSRSLIVRSLRLMNDRMKELGVFEQYRDQLVFINLKHIYLRFEEFDLYKDRKSQLELVNSSFRLLNHYFPDWRRNPGSFKKFRLPVQYNFRRWCYKHRFYWIIVSLMPLKWVQDDKERFEKSKKPARDNKKYYVACLERYSVDPDTALFESDAGRSLSGSPYALLLTFLKEHPEGTAWVVYSRLYKKQFERFIKVRNLKVRLVDKTSMKYHKIMATAGLLVNDGTFPLCFVRRKYQHFIYTGRGVPVEARGRRRPGSMALMANLQHNVLQSDLVLVPDEYSKKRLTDDLGIEKLYTGKILTCPDPILPLLMDRDYREQMRKLAGVEDKRVIAYMPVGRVKLGRKEDPVYTAGEVLKALDQALDDDAVLYAELRYTVQTDLDYSEFSHVKPLPEGWSAADLLCASDCLISDHLGIMYDYAYTGRKVTVFDYDLDNFMVGNMLAIMPDDMPFNHVEDLEGLVSMVKDGSIYRTAGRDAGNPTGWNYSAPLMDSICSDLIDIREAGQSGDEVQPDIFKNPEMVSDYSENSSTPWKLYVIGENVKDRQDFDGIIKDLDTEHTIVAIRNQYFHSHMDQWFQEKYNDELTFVIYGYSRLLDPADEKLFRSGSPEEKKRVRALARKRGYMRTLPGLDLINTGENNRVI